MVAEACHPSTQGTEVEGSQAKVSLGEAMKSHLKTNEWTNTHQGFEFIQFFSPEPSVNYVRASSSLWSRDFHFCSSSKQFTNSLSLNFLLGNMGINNYPHLGKINKQTNKKYQL